VQPVAHRTTEHFVKPECREAFAFRIHQRVSVAAIAACAMPQKDWRVTPLQIGVFYFLTGADPADQP